MNSELHKKRIDELRQLAGLHAYMLEYPDGADSVSIAIEKHVKEIESRLAPLTADNTFWYVLADAFDIEYLAIKPLVDELLKDLGGTRYVNEIIPHLAYEMHLLREKRELHAFALNALLDAELQDTQRKETD